MEGAVIGGGEGETGGPGVGHGDERRHRLPDRRGRGGGMVVQRDADLAGAVHRGGRSRAAGRRGGKGGSRAPCWKQLGMVVPPEQKCLEQNRGDAEPCQPAARCHQGCPAEAARQFQHSPLRTMLCALMAMPVRASSAEKAARSITHGTGTSASHPVQCRWS